MPDLLLSFYIGIVLFSGPLSGIAGRPDLSSPPRPPDRRLTLDPASFPRGRRIPRVRRNEEKSWHENGSLCRGHFPVCALSPLRTGRDGVRQKTKERGGRRVRNHHYHPGHPVGSGVLRVPYRRGADPCAHRDRPDHSDHTTVAGPESPLAGAFRVIGPIGPAHDGQEEFRLDRALISRGRPLGGRL